MENLRRQRRDVMRFWANSLQIDCNVISTDLLLFKLFLYFSLHLSAFAPFSPFLTGPDGSLKVGNETDTLDELASSFKSIFFLEKMAEPLFSVGRGKEGDEDLNGRWNLPATRNPKP